MNGCIVAVRAWLIANASSPHPLTVQLFDCQILLWLICCVLMWLSIKKSQKCRRKFPTLLTGERHWYRYHFPVPYYKFKSLLVYHAVIHLNTLCFFVFLFHSILEWGCPSFCVYGNILQLCWWVAPSDNEVQGDWGNDHQQAKTRRGPSAPCLRKWKNLVAKGQFVTKRNCQKLTRTCEFLF